MICSLKLSLQFGKKYHTLYHVSPTRLTRTQTNAAPE
ncbi:unnamed protein product [Tenebrio molitor]|nr:unnamed protein product [Tenebrio molitor]